MGELSQVRVHRESHVSVKPTETVNAIDPAHNLRGTLKVEEFERQYGDASHFNLIHAKMQMQFKR